MHVAAHGPKCDSSKLVLLQFRPGKVFTHCPQVSEHSNIIEFIVGQARFPQIPENDVVVLRSKIGFLCG